MGKARATVLVLYNALSEEGYDQLRHVDPATLGFEPEYDIAVPTVTEEYDAIVAALRAEGFQVRQLNLLDDVRNLEKVVRRQRPDVVFNLVESFRDDAELESAVAAFLDLYGVAYTGATPLSLSMCRRKGLTKRILISHDVPTPRFLSLWKPKIAVRHGLHYPLIVKPAREDASAGVEAGSVVHDRAQLLARLEHVFQEFQPPILVEEFIEGRELHVGVLGNADPAVLPPLEYDFSELPEGEPPIITYAAKWDPLAEVFHRVGTRCPAPLTKRLEQRVHDVCIRAYRVMGCRDYARLDIRISTKNQPYVLEINPNPDLTEGVSFMESAEAAGYSFGQALATIVELALERRQPPTAAAGAPVGDLTSA
ncbi:MAG TPA: ATP-grasp domain-containing protein [Gemmatimonadales bacterium]|nr:ATP-grasp domain-containing protein [Gemmatimonadales bacterium]